MYRLIRALFKDLGFDILPDVRIVNEFKKQMECGAVETSKVDFVSKNGEKDQFDHAEVTNIEELICQRITNLFKKDVLDLTEDKIKICLLGDKGATTTKLGIVIKLKDHALSNSLNNLTLISLFRHNDTYTNMEKCYQKISSQLDKIKSIKLHGKEYEIEKHLTGDYKFLSTVIGHRGASAAYPCIKCISKTRVGKRGKTWAQFRVCMNRKKAATSYPTNHFSLDRKPILNNIDPDCIHCPFLHILMGIFESSHTSIRKYLYELDNPKTDQSDVSFKDTEGDELMDVSNASEDEMMEQSNASKEEIDDIIEDEDEENEDEENDDEENEDDQHSDCSDKEDDNDGEGEEVTEIITSEWLKTFDINVKSTKAKASKHWQTFSGNNVSKILNKVELLFVNFDEMNLAGKEVLDGYKKIFEALKEVKSYSVARELNPMEIECAIKATDRFKKAISSKTLGLTVQPKAHLLATHMPEQIKKYKSLNYFSEQPIESLHALINRNMIRVSGLSDSESLKYLIHLQNQRSSFYDTQY
uniref:YqaJ domain-containing protein n=1 Tax=Rhabditophanes sp. KR3021 TaxID=114890 RepID=A0AC35TT87_9BILA